MSNKRDRDKRQDRKERRQERNRLEQGVSPSRVKRSPTTVKEAQRLERVEQSRLNATFRAPTVPDYKARVTAKVVDSRPINPITIQGVMFTPSPVKQTPKKEAGLKKQAFQKKEHDSSPSARDDHNRKDICKKRPDKLTPRRAGGGASKKFVPWCK